MSNSQLVDRINLFVKSMLQPKTIVETVHRGGKVFQRHRRIMVRSLEVGMQGKLVNGDFVVVKKLPDKYLIKFTNGPDKGKLKYFPKEVGQEVHTATEQPIPKIPTPAPEQPKVKREVPVKRTPTEYKNLPSYIIPSAAKRINKLMRKVESIKYLSDHTANVVKVLNGAHHPKKIKYNGIEGIFKAVGDIDKNKFLPSKKNVLTEVCSYEISRALKFNFVPPTIAKTIGAEFGTVQQFVTGVEGIRIPIKERKAILSSPLGRQMAIYDFITGNRDRHDGNWMYDADKKKIWAIDNGNSFPTEKRYYIKSNFISNFQGVLSKEEKFLISRKSKKMLRYIKSYFGEVEAQSAAKRINYMLTTGKMNVGWIEEKSL